MSEENGLKETPEGKSAAEEKVLEYPSMEGLRNPAEEKILQERKSEDQFQLKYPSMQEGASGQIKTESPPGLQTKDDRTGDLLNEKVELNDQDPEFVDHNEMMQLLSQDTQEGYKELADRVEADLISLGAPEDGREFELLRYAKSFAVDSKPWKDWIRTAVTNLSNYKKAVRLGLIEKDES